MPALDNPKHERFAQLVAKGETPTNAYVKAGYSESGAHASANRLLQKATVCDRVAELKPDIQERAIQATGIDKAAVMEGLAENVALARQAGQIAAANQAYSLIGKELGMFVDRADITTRTVKELLESASEEDLKAARVAILARRKDAGTVSVQ